MDADFSDTDYMLFEETADAGLTSDEVIHNILSVCRKPASTSFDKITDDGIISSAYKYNDDVLLDQPGSPPMNLLTFGSSTTMDLPDENGENIEFGDTIPFENLLSSTDIGGIEEHYIQSVSSGGDFLDTEDNDLTLFKELRDNRKLSCPSDQSVSSTCLELIDDNFEQDVCKDFNYLEQSEAEKNCRVQFFKMSSLKDNRRTRNGPKDNAELGNGQIQTALNSDSLEKRYVLLVDASDDETIEDNRSLITFLEFDPNTVAQDEVEVSCQNNEQEFPTSYEFFFDGEGKEIPPSEVVDLDPNLNAGSFILDCNENLNQTSSIPIIELEGLEKLKDREEVRCANEAIVVISSESECTTGQIEEELLSNSREEPPGNVETLEDNKTEDDCVDGFDSNEQTPSESPKENALENVDGGSDENINFLKNDFMELEVVENERDTSVTIFENIPELPVGINIEGEVDDCLPQEALAEDGIQDEVLPHDDLNSSKESNYKTLPSDENDPHVISAQSEDASIENESSLGNSQERKNTDECKDDSEAAGEEAVDHLNHAEEPEQPENTEKPSSTDSEEINTEELIETNSDDDSSVPKIQEVPQEQRIVTSDPTVEESPKSQEPVVPLAAQESGEKVEHAMRETGDEMANESTEKSGVNTEGDSDFENQGSTVDALQFMLLREMWRNKGFERRQPNAVKSDLEQNEVFIALLKEFLMKKNSNKYIPQLKGIDVFIKERNIQAGVRNKEDNIESQKDNCFRQNNRSSEETSLDKAPVIIINKCYLQITELGVPRLEKEKVVESIQKSFSKDGNTTPNESSHIPKNNPEVTKPNCKYQIEETVPLSKEFSQSDDTSETKKTADLNLESKDFVAETETNDGNGTTDKSIDDACSTASDCSFRGNEPLCSDVELEKDVAITDGQCSSNICDSSEILRLKYLNDISFQPFVKLEVLNMRDNLEKYRQENRKTHRRISPRITNQTKHDKKVECEVPTSQNGKDTNSESCPANNTSQSDTIENIISPEPPKSIEASETVIMREAVKQSEDENVPKADNIRPKRTLTSIPVIAQTAITEKINGTNILVPRLERIDTLLNLPMKLNEPLKPLKLIYEIGRKLVPTIDDIYQNKATKHQRNLSPSQKYHARRRRRKQSNTNVEKIIPDGSRTDDATRDTVPRKAGDGNDNLEDKKTPDSETKELSSERLTGSDLPSSLGKRPTGRTKTVGKTINNGKIRVVRFTRVNSPVKRKRGRPRVRDPTGEEPENVDFTSKDTTEVTSSISEVLVNQGSERTSPAKRRKSALQVGNSMVQSDPKNDELLPRRTRSMDSRQLRKLDIADHEEKINDSVPQTTQHTSGSEVNQHSDEIPVIQKKRARPRRQNTTREEVESEKLICEEPSQRTLETVVHQEADNTVSTAGMKSKLRTKTNENAKRRKKKSNRLLFNRRKRHRNSPKLRRSNISHPEEKLLKSEVPTAQDTPETEVGQCADGTPLVDRRRHAEAHQESTSTELEHEELACTSIHEEVSEAEKTVLLDQEPEVQVAESASGSLIAKSADVPIKRKRGRLPVVNLIQKKQKTDELSFENRKIIETMKLKRLTVVLDHNEVIDNLPVRATPDIPRTALNQNCPEGVSPKRKRGRSSLDLIEDKLEDNESECTNTDHDKTQNVSDPQPDVPIRRKRAKLHDEKPVKQQAEPSGVLIEKLSTDDPQLESSDKSEGDDQTAVSENDKSEDDHLQNTSDSFVTETPRRKVAKDGKALESGEEVKSASKTVDPAKMEEKENNLCVDGNSSDEQNDKKVEDLPEKSSETSEIPLLGKAVGTMQQARNNLHNELYKLYFTNFFTTNGHIVRFQYVSGRLAVLDAKIANADEAESFVKTFAQFDCANYLLWKDFDRERYILHRTWLCGTNGHQSPDVLYKSLSCQARIHVSIKQPSSSDYNAHVLIYMEHTHNSMSKEKLVNISK